MKINVEVEITCLKDALYLHTQLGEGTYDGRQLQMQQTNTGISLQVANKNNLGWKTYSLTWSSIAEILHHAIDKEIITKDEVTP